MAKHYAGVRAKPQPFFTVYSYAFGKIAEGLGGVLYSDLWQGPPTQADFPLQRFRSLDAFRRNMTSLVERAKLDRVRIVLAHTDPGVPNWLDTEGRQRGMLIYRWVWSRDAPTPVARVTKPEALRELLPVDHPVITPDERRLRLSQRRAQVWSRLR